MDYDTLKKVAEFAGIKTSGRYISIKDAKIIFGNFPAYEINLRLLAPEGSIAILKAFLAKGIAFGAISTSAECFSISPQIPFIGEIIVLLSPKPFLRLPGNM